MSIIGNILEVSRELSVHHRSMYSVMTKLSEEVGELATEVHSEIGDGYKEEGSDGVLGEIADVIIVAVDLAYAYDKSITEEDIFHFTEEKCRKWKKVYEDKKVGLNLEFEEAMSLLKSGEVMTIVGKDYSVKMRDEAFIKFYGTDDSESWLPTLKEITSSNWRIVS